MFLVAKAVGIALVIMALLASLPIMMLILAPVLSFAALVVVVWFVLKVLQDDGEEDGEEPGPP